MTNTCANCNSGFEVTQADLDFLEKVSPEIDGKKYVFAPPEICPHCRQQRRMSFRNERKLYYRNCDVTGKDIISIFSPDSPHKVCEKDHWYSDEFDPLEYGRDYDFDKPFFQQFKELEMMIPLPSIRVERSENCDFNNDMRDCSNCYMCSRTHMSQNLLYTYRGNKSSNSADCMQITKSDGLYQCVECVNCNNSKFLYFCSECSDSAYMMDCRNCMDCFMCTNMRNKRYCFLNEQLSKEDYYKKLEEFDTGALYMVHAANEMFADMKKRTIRRNLMIVNCENSTGDNLFDCKKCHMCFGTQFSEDGRHLWDVKLYKDSMDAYSGGRNSELIYYTTAVAASYNVQFCLRTSECRDVMYSFFINSSKNIFGCIGLKRNEYCILNKQYSKEDYEALLPKIIEHMQSTGEFGKFFPPEIAPYAYNETVAHEYFPLKKNDAINKGYRWQDDPQKESKPQSYKIPDNISEIDEWILEQTLSCESCGKNYRIVQQELAFYKKFNVIIPRHCVDCRHLERLSTKNPPHLRESKCKQCSKDVTTTFPEDTEMQIYCRECYLEDVT